MSIPSTAARRIAGDFLQTVIIVDDQADLEISSQRPGLRQEEPVSAVEPANEGSPRADDQDSQNLQEDSDENVKGEVEPNADLAQPAVDLRSVEAHGDLDAKTIINDFAKLGLVCGVIKPEQGEDIGPVVSMAAERADILVLDWWIHADDGATSKEIISEIANSQDQRDRMRLIIIYTAVSDLPGVASDVARGLPGATVFGEHSNKVMAGSLAIIVLAKPDTEVDASLSDYVVPFSEFPGRVVSEFARVVEGLLSNVAFSALAAIRRNTHKILSRFDRVLDPAYLGHRMLLSDPEDAERHLVELVLQEFSAVVESAAIGKNANDASIEGLLADNILGVTESGKFGEVATRQHVTFDDLAMRLVREGLDAVQDVLAPREQKQVRSWISTVFSSTAPGDSGPPIDAGKMWSMLMSSKLQYADLSPELHLGVVVRHLASGNFMLCMQPACDSVRLASQTQFPFLPLEEAEGVADFIVKYSGEYHLVNLRTRIRDLVMISFTPGTGGMVSATMDDAGKAWHFLPAAGGNGQTLEWVGELRESFAHKFANRFAESASRVGTDDSELHRR